MDLTPKQEAYCRARAEGLSQRKAYRHAYPSSQKWKDKTVDAHASDLESNGKVLERLEELKEALATKVLITRSEVINGMAKTFKRGSQEDKLSMNAVTAVSSIGKTLLDVLPEERPATTDWKFDFGTLLTSDFLDMHRLIDTEAETDYWCRGGRGSLKSTTISLELIKYLETHPDRHAVVFMKVQNTIRDAAYAQVTWAISQLGLDAEYDQPGSTLRMTKKSTKQLIIFRGCDNPDKLKSVKVPFGSIGFVWFEEVDQFNGMSEIRKVLQSATRGADEFIRCYSANPPRSQTSWFNKYLDERTSQGKRVFSSNYLNVPPEWLGKAFIDDAEDLKESDPLAYAHEYMGEPVGNGTEVFDRVEFRAITDEEIATFDNLKAGQDFGWYPDPWAFVLSEWQAGSRTLLTYREDVANKLTPPQQAKRIKTALTWKDRPEDEKPQYHYLPIMSDDADPQSIASQRDNNVNARAAGKGNMRDASYKWLQSVKWVIDPVRCPHLAEEVRSLQYEVNKDGEVLNSIPDGNDHCIDAVRYSVMPLVHRARSAYR